MSLICRRATPDRKPGHRLSSKLKRALVGLLLAGMAGTGSAASVHAPAAVALTPAMRSYYVAKLANNDAGRFDLLAASPVVDPQRDVLLDALVTWDRVRRDNAPTSFAELVGFLRSYPGWPGEIAMRRHAEKLIDASVLPDAQLKYFAAFPPLSAVAQLRLAESQLATGHAAEATALARKAWTSPNLYGLSEAALQSRFGSQLTAADYQLRFDWLLWNGQASTAARLLTLLPPDHAAWAAARLALRINAPDAEARWAAVPAAQQCDAGLVLDRALWLRSHGDLTTARTLLAGYNQPPGLVTDPDTWLRVRLEFARAALREGQYDLAYRIAANHHALPFGRLLNDHPLGQRQLLLDTEWTAGWIALRKLNRPDDALRHLEAVRDIALTPVSQARGDYWAGRAAAAAHQTQAARALYAAAATHADYYYGQLAAEELGSTPPLPPAQVVKVGTAARAKFDRDTLVRMARDLGALGDRARQSLFLHVLVDRADSLEGQRLLGDLAIELDRPDLGVLTGKAARSDGELSLYDIAYPQLALPVALDPSWTMIHAISRQESQFDRAALSRANARGLMQLLPGTAADTAAKLGLPYSTPRLIDDPVYNVTLGAAYFARLKSQFGGSHVLAVAAYNAGPGNVRKFIAANGDPREPGTDVVDWVEAIPFSETRDYVQRVLGNAVVYDALHPATAVMLSKKRLAEYLGNGAR